uniref:Centriolar coiled-coil protein of 110 kDa n=1 Tax=Sphenodon punctatus TaxID=8508 RepID=A0A8D0GH55_SPHPU
MEDYETFCEKHLTRIKGESVQRETCPSAQHRNISFIQFHGVPVLSPLLSLERKKKMQQEKQKALDLEIRRQNSRKKALLNRVQEILGNVQIRKVSSVSDLDEWEAENTYADTESKIVNGFTTQSNVNLPSSTAHHDTTEPEKMLETIPSDMQVTSNGINPVKDAEECISPKQNDDAGTSLLDQGACPKFASPKKTQNVCTLNAHLNEEDKEVLSAEAEGPDPYVMSLQNLLKKSRDYIEREQAKRSLRNNSKRNVNESHSDKENDAVMPNDLVKERARFTGRNCTTMTLDKPSLNKSNILLQGSSTQTHSTTKSASPSFSKVDIPMRSGTPPILDSDSDEEFKTSSILDHESSIVRSLTGSYAKLPSPEPSMSPKMHRRRPRPLSMGHIVINHPVNAYELSPKDKGRAMDLIAHDVADKTSTSEPVPKLISDFTVACSSKAHVVVKNLSDICDGLVFGKLNQIYQQPVSRLETKGILVSATMEGQLPLDGRGPLKIASSTDIVSPKLNEPYAVSQTMVAQKSVTTSGIKSTNMLEKTKDNSPLELNKSYDVENPSPLLLQSQHNQQQADTPNVTSGSEQLLGNGFEKVKRRLDLDIDSSRKENHPYVLTVGIDEQEKRQLEDRRCPIESVYISKNETMDKEEILKNKTLAFEEMRKRLEEQHAQQLSILILEQEREQERLQKEIEDQERRLKGKKSATAETEIPKMHINNGIELEWRKISASVLLESMLTQVETVHSTNSTSTGFANTTLPSSIGSGNESPFYLWGPQASGISKMSAPKSVNRNKMRWSQVICPDMQLKFSKITAVVKGFLTRRLLQTEKVKYLRQTVKDTMEFIKNFRSEAPLKRGAVSAQDASLQERVIAQLRAALYDIHDVFFVMEVSERMNILHHDREVRKEKMLRQMVAAEMGMPNKKVIIKQKTPETRVLQPNQGQNAPIHRLLSRQGTPKTSLKGVEQSRKKPSESRVSNKVLSGV